MELLKQLGNRQTDLIEQLIQIKVESNKKNLGINFSFLMHISNMFVQTIRMNKLKFTIIANNIFTFLMTFLTCPDKYLLNFA